MDTNKLIRKRPSAAEDAYFPTISLFMPNIRTFTETDIDKAQQFMALCAPLAEQNPFSYWMLAKFYGKQCFILEEEGEWLGFLGSISHEQGTFIWQLGVHPACRGQRYAAKLIERLASTSKQSIQIAIDPQNTACLRAFQHFAQHFGYTFGQAPATPPQSLASASANLYTLQAPSAQLQACSHLVIATEQVPNMCRFFSQLFDIQPFFENDMFAEYKLPTGFRIAFFKPVGKSAKFFNASVARGSVSFGLTVRNVDAVHDKVLALSEAFPLQTAGPPKDHPWGERSFLLIDPDGNRWEITQSPSEGGMLVDR
jgi:uncharacterized glyoxalase superfamily protein PhnB/GNAT superfamily N-acetyltransferase